MVDYSLYFHIPFCTQKCGYCHFYVVPDRPLLKERFTEALSLEWQLQKDLLPKYAPRSIYFGGGTPALLEPHHFEKILSWISHNANTEITLEINPEIVTLEKLQAFASLGINRISMGVQALDDTLLTKLNRTHSSTQAIEAAHTIHKAGIHNLSIDLMFDLPTQTLTQWEETLIQTKSLPITHLSLYNLTIEPHTAFYKHKQKIQSQIPSPQTSLEMFNLAKSHFQQQGFEHYEISAFAKPSYPSIHNTGYWQGRPFIGFGPSAYSYWNHKRFCNTPNLNRYWQTLKKGSLPTHYSEELSSDARAKELLTVGLRMRQGVPKDTIASTSLQAIQKLKGQGLLHEEQNHLKLTEKGILFHDTVACELI